MKKLGSRVQVDDHILIVRDRRVILDADLARLYGVTTIRLNQQVSRNRHRFPHDFMFVLTPIEKSEVIAKCNHLRNLKFSATLPKAFTEHGAVMVASVLNTPIAVEASIQVVRAFVRLRSLLAAQKDLAEMFRKLEEKLGTHDVQIQGLFEAIRHLMVPPDEPKRPIGYRPEVESTAK